MHLFAAEFETRAGLLVESLQQLFSCFDPGTLTTNGELVAPMADRYPQPVLDMTNMFIELAAEVSQLCDIVRLERDGDNDVFCF